MREIITKELLNEVLGYIPYKIDSIKPVSGIGLTLVLLNKDNTVKSYQNIYELAHKCKNKATEYGYLLLEHPLLVEVYNEKKQIRCCKITDKITELYLPKRIFDALQWILDNKYKS